MGNKRKLSGEIISMFPKHAILKINKKSYKKVLQKKINL